jgi:hypothetical protein
MYLRKSYDLLIMFDMINSISNIILHCLCGKHFRNELRRIFQSCYQLIKHLLTKICCCYFKIHFQQYKKDAYIYYNASITANDSSNSSNNIYLKVQTAPRLLRNQCCEFRWYFNRRPLIECQQCSSRISKECLQEKRMSFSIHRRLLTQRKEDILPTRGHSMRLYFPQQETSKLPKTNKKWFTFFRC